MLVAVILLLSGCGDDAPATSAHPAATLTPLAVQPAPPPPAEPVVVPTPPTPVGPAIDAAARDARIESWLSTTLRGHDNNMARMRSVRIRRSNSDPGAFVVTIANQFRWTCALEFGPEGSPSMLRRCRSGEGGWFAQPDEIPLTCETRGQDELCAGRYTLGASGGMRMPARFQIIRPL